MNVVDFIKCCLGADEAVRISKQYHLGRLERNFAKADLLILDELSFNSHQTKLLFKVILDRS